VTDAYVHSFTSMGTVATIHIVGRGANDADRIARQHATATAAAWFDEIERICSRFNPESELTRLSTRIGERVRVSELLFEAVRFALAVADESGGAFDPTIGLLLCQENNRITVEYALRDVKKPIGVAQWKTKLVDSLPKNLRGALPSVAQLERELADG